MADDQAEALAAFRASNYEHIYLRPSSVAQGGPWSPCSGRWSSTSATGPTSSPSARAGCGGLVGGEPGAVRAAVAYVAGMTDRFAFSQAVALLGWDPDKLPGHRRDQAAMTGSGERAAPTAATPPAVPLPVEGPGIVGPHDVLAQRGDGHGGQLEVGDAERDRR